jgi:hypothetical protein
MQTKRSFSINDAISNVPDEGTMRMRIEKIEVGVASDSSKHPGSGTLKFQATVVDGPDEGKKCFWTRSLTPGGIGFLASDLGMSQVFTQEEADDTSLLNLDDPEGICSILQDKMVGKVFMVEVKHQQYQQRKSGNYALVGAGGL